MDTQLVHILNATIDISKYKNNIMVLVSHNVKTSIKADTYDIGVAFTKATIAAFTCTCKDWLNTKEEILCVQILLVMY